MNVQTSIHLFSFIFLMTVPNAHTCSNSRPNRTLPGAIKVKYKKTTEEEATAGTVLAQKSQQNTSNLSSGLDCIFLFNNQFYKIHKNIKPLL